MGFRVELKYPIHKKKETRVWLNWWSLKMAITSAKMKKGNQQAMKAPVTMAKVLAAFLSLLASSEICFFFISFKLKSCWLSGCCIKTKGWNISILLLKFVSNYLWMEVGIFFGHAVGACRMLFGGFLVSSLGLTSLKRKYQI